MLLSTRGSANQCQQQAEGPQQCDRSPAYFAHVRTPDESSAVDSSAPGPEGQSSSRPCHSTNRLFGASRSGTFARPTLSHHRAQSKLFACVSSGGEACPVSSAVA